MDPDTKKLFESAFYIMKLLNEEMAIQRRLSEILDDRVQLIEIRDLRNLN